MSIVESLQVRRRKQRRAGSTPVREVWWLWPHLLSLDAPLVAVVWLRWWARAAAVRVPWGCAFILGGGVWLIYVVDRLADTAAPSRRDHETARHAFYSRERRFMGLAAGLILCVLAILSPCLLPPREFAAGLGLVGLAGGYFWLIHCRTGAGWARALPKEGVVGAMFAVGTAFFVVGQTGRPDLAASAAYAMFGGLCFLNCALITKWERTPPDLREASSLLNAFPRLIAHLDAGCLGLGLLAAVALCSSRAGLFVPIMLSAALLAMLDRCKDRLSVNVLRVLVDAALLTPWLCGSLACSADPIFRTRPISFLP